MRLDEGARMERKIEAEKQKVARVSLLFVLKNYSSSSSISKPRSSRIARKI